MKLVLVIYSGANRLIVPQLLDRHHVTGWTELSGAHGVGATGRHEGSRAWPGDAALFFSLVPADEAEKLAGALRDAAGALPPGDRLHVATLAVETFN